LVYKIFRSAAIQRDLDLIFDHLFQSYVALGDPKTDAFERAVRRIENIKSDMDVLACTPHQGTLDQDIEPGLRHVTKNRAVFYFHVDEEAEIVRLIAVFFGGQNHQRRMLARIQGS
jgi:toxin ParE1/3/4